MRSISPSMTNRGFPHRRDAAGQTRLGRGSGNLRTMRRSVDSNPLVVHGRDVIGISKKGTGPEGSYFLAEFEGGLR